MSYSDIFQINYIYSNSIIKKQNKITQGIKLSIYSILASIISSFLMWGIQYSIIKGLTNQEKENLEIYDYITTVVVAAINGFMSVFLPRDAFLFVASINAVIISNLIYIYFNGEKEDFNLVSELIVTIITVIIIFKIVIKLFENISILPNKDTIEYLIIVNIILNIALTIDFSIYNRIFNNTSNLIITEDI